MTSTAFIIPTTTGSLRWTAERGVDVATTTTISIKLVGFGKVRQAYIRVWMTLHKLATGHDRFAVRIEDGWDVAVTCRECGERAGAGAIKVETHG